MKIDPSEQPQAQPTQAKESFKKVLQHLRHEPLAAGAKTARGAKTAKGPHLGGLIGGDSAHAAHATAHTAHPTLSAGQRRVETAHADARFHRALTSARKDADSHVELRQTDRAEGMLGTERQLKERIAELVARDQGHLPDPAQRTNAPHPEPKDRRDPEPPSIAATDAKAPTAPQAAQGPEAVSSVMALVERVELFVRSQRPTLALTLGGELSGQVEIEKVGPGKVALRWVGGASRDPQAPERIRRALAERGLTVTRLQVG